MLCVDDEPEVLAALRDLLRRDFEVDVATSGAEALALLRGQPRRYAVVVSDMRMPHMSGAEFLRRARRVAPLATRMLLTGHADVESAIGAVNDGHIFRYLTKPCDREELLRAALAAAWQHRLTTTERALLSEMARGAVDALADVLAIACPPAFERGARARELLGSLAAEIGLDDASELAAAGALAHLGAVSLPVATASRHFTGRPLSRPEQAAVARVRPLTDRLLGRIPRLDGVRQILASCDRRFDSAAHDGPLPLGARAVHIALDYAQLEAEGVGGADAVATMRARAGEYDPDLLEAFAREPRAA